MERQIRLRKNEDFVRVYRRGIASYTRDFTLIAKRNGAKGNRYGFSISKKMGKANKRNLLKRRLREIVRLNEARFPVGYDFVIIPKEAARELDYRELMRSLVYSAARLENVLHKKKDAARSK
ncbi:MAG: ribonuclease P protein component [Ndongobacter sp.]|nr:ribonuclease P protein component [Ndongobacter sp.]